MPVRRNLSGGSRGSTYLRNLQFDPKLKNSFIAGYLTNLRVLILIKLSLFFKNGVLIV